VHQSLRRLQTDRIDILQIHWRIYTDEEVQHILHGGPLDALIKLREEGTIGHIGITTEEPWTVLLFLKVEDIEVYQIAYNLIYQAAARHFLIEAAKVNAGVVTMRTMTSGVLQREASFLAPEWQNARDLYEVALKFVLSGSRISAGIVRMRWPDEVRDNRGLGATDMATCPGSRSKSTKRTTGRPERSTDAGCQPNCRTGGRNARLAICPLIKSADFICGQRRPTATPSAVRWFRSRREM